MLLVAGTVVAIGYITYAVSGPKDLHREQSNGMEDNDESHGFLRQQQQSIPKDSDSETNPVPHAEVTSAINRVDVKSTPSTTGVPRLQSAQQDNRYPRNAWVTERFDIARPPQGSEPILRSLEEFLTSKDLKCIQSLDEVSIFSTRVSCPS